MGPKPSLFDKEFDEVYVGIEKLGGRLYKRLEDRWKKVRGGQGNSM